MKIEGLCTKIEGLKKKAWKRTEQNEHCLKSLQITFDFVIGVIVITNLVYLTKCRKKNANEPHGVQRDSDWGK